VNKDFHKIDGLQHLLNISSEIHAQTYILWVIVLKMSTGPVGSRFSYNMAGGVGSKILEIFFSTGKLVLAL